jgi:Tol biopolymer transport system component
MPLTTGARIGQYEVLGPLGAGGMGEVYRARDAKLNRDVAIKVLPDLFNSDPERLARFRREAQVLASLNHPNIGHIYGLEDASAVHALILELVEGPTLQDRIDQGAIPLDEALPVARQIADALECAHELGIVHRDLKPANIKIRPDGTVKVLDFGLAKAFDVTSGSGPEVINSPTFTARSTMMGVVLGTAAYMAPEQARGRTVDRRADIWAFGVVLFEMLTGKRAFEGDDISITLANVLKDDLDWKSLPPGLPRPIQRLLRRCLEKDPKKRLSSIGDARLDLDDALAGRVEDDGAAAPAAAPAQRRGAALLPWALAALAVVALAAAMIVWKPWRTSPRPGVLRVSAEAGLPADAELAAAIAPAIALSPDGQTMAIVAASAGRNVLLVRRMDQLNATPLAATAGATAPFFSPDGEWVAFFAEGKLKKIAVTGGAAMTLCDAANGRGGAWFGDTIVFTPASTPNVVLHKVSASGGAAVALGKLAEEEITQRWPQVLPGGQWVLYSGNSSTTQWDSGNIMLMPMSGGTPTRLLAGGFHARYLTSGHIVYINQGTLFAVPFDVAQLKITGSPVPVIEKVFANVATGSAQLAASDAGTIAYLTGDGASSLAPIHLMDASGQAAILREQPADWAYPRFSPDGTKLALTIFDAGSSDVWIHEPGRDLTKLTFEAKSDLAPVWTPDGRRIVFASDRGAKDRASNIYWQRADGTGDVERLTESPLGQIPFSFHPGGKYLAYIERGPTTGSDIKILPIEGDEKTGFKAGAPTTFLGSPTIEFSPMFSPDGRWIAYMANETGQMEIYVRPFQGSEGKWKVSTGGGIFPTWSTRTNELLYIQLGSSAMVMTVPYTVQADSFRADAPRLWSKTPVRSMRNDRPFDLHPDGRRLAMAAVPGADKRERLSHAILLFNFFDELRRVAPVK